MWKNGTSVIHAESVHKHLGRNLNGNFLAKIIWNMPIVWKLLGTNCSLVNACKAHGENTTGLCTLDIMVQMNHELAIANILLPMKGWDDSGIPVHKIAQA